MTQVEVSHRLTSTVHTKVWMGLPFDTRMAFLHEASRVENVSDMSPQNQKIVMDAENELIALGYIRDDLGRLRPPPQSAPATKQKRVRASYRGA